MKSLWSYSWILMGLTAGLTMAACNKGGGGEVTGPAPGVVLGPQAPVGTNTRISFFTQSANFPAPSFGSVFTPGSGFKTLLKDVMGVCDRQNQVGGANYGLAACDAWINGVHDMVIAIDGSAASQVKLVIRSAPQQSSPNYWYTASIPSFGQVIGGLLGIPYGVNYSGFYDPLVLNMSIWNVNNSQGFEMRPINTMTYSYGWNKLIQFQVPNGKIEDPTLNFIMYIDGGNQQMLPAISGTMVRCPSADCGLVGL